LFSGDESAELLSFFGHFLPDDFMGNPFGVGIVRFRQSGFYLSAEPLVVFGFLGLNDDSFV